MIELFDERPLENVLGAEMFRPQRIVYICPAKVARDQRLHKKLKTYFEHRHQKVELVFTKARLYDAEALLKMFRQTAAKYPDCALDITGGTDAALFAAGLLSAESPIPVFTYSRRSNKFFSIRNAAFADGTPCQVRYTVEDFFMMAGGSMRAGRVDNGILDQYLDVIDPFFAVYLKHRSDWNKIVTYIQRVSQPESDGYCPLDVSGAYTVKGERAGRISAPEEALRDLQKIGFLSGLAIDPEDGVRFRFRDRQIRTWLRDVGSVLELYVYKACLDSGLFDDVRTSAVVDWEGDARANAVTNELDVMCTRGVTPVFISCKTCDVKTEALNELAILRDRFGGKIARAAIVTAEQGGTAMRNRAAELGISVIDLNDLSAGRIGTRIRKLMKNS